ncbi:MAG: GatB/YqeY domain-containing protein [Patescibacteria group bacterium]|nr:GatB/YqeY domain-containing protein [Patescibacteria group bacterium]MDD4611251.1 GatB/YqeY domain-containing protein [Patescibacteria group bacterium]
MANIEEGIKADLKAAMQEKKEETISTLRLVISALRNKEISLRTAGSAELTDEQVIEVISSEIKKRNDSIEAYKQGERKDLVEKEQREIEILKKYLPTQANDEEIERVVREISDANAEKNFGKIMGQTMARLKGKADGNRVGEIVKKILGS